MKRFSEKTLIKMKENIRKLFDDLEPGDRVFILYYVDKGEKEGTTEGWLLNEVYAPTIARLLKEFLIKYPGMLTTLLDMLEEVLPDVEEEDTDLN